MDEQRQDNQLKPTYNSCADTGCSLEDLPEAMDDREEWWEMMIIIIHSFSIRFLYSTCFLLQLQLNRLTASLQRGKTHLQRLF